MTIFKFIPFGGTGGGPANLDRFAPKYLVGNVNAGDSPSTYSLLGFTYYGDPGDGTGIAAALAAAGGGSAGDVYIRPGVYSWAGPGPLTVPNGVRVVGAGEKTIINFTVPSGAGSDGRLFLLGNQSALRDIFILASDLANGQANGPAIICVDDPVGGASAHCERVSVKLSRQAGSASLVRSVFYVPAGSKLTADRCDTEVSGTADTAFDLSSWTAQGGLELDLCKAIGGDRGVTLVGSRATLEQSTIEGFAYFGVHATAGSDLSIQGSRIVSDAQTLPDGVFCSGTASEINLGGSRVEVPCVVSATNAAVRLDVEAGQVTGNRIHGSFGVDSNNASGLGVTFGFNSLTALAGQQISTQVVDEAAHNIPSECTPFTLLIDTQAVAIGGNTPETNSDQFRFYGVGTYTIDWGDTNIDTNVTGTQTHTYTSAGQYIVRVYNWTGASRQYLPPFATATDAIKILELQAWGPTQWTSCERMFQVARRMIGTYSDAPNLSTPNLSCADMFRSCSAFNGSLNANMGNWNTANVADMNDMFSSATLFNQNINGWNTSNVTNMAGMFAFASAFNQSLNSWDVSNVTSMAFMFSNATAFNGAIGNWKTGSVTNMFYMFRDATAFNQPINAQLGGVWDVSNVTDMEGMFYDATSFNQAIGLWDVSSVTDMTEMFRGATAFNQNISGWSTTSVLLMASMFRSATSFNQPINSWNVSTVFSMSQMFRGATAFNQSLNSWNVSNVTNMFEMFRDANAFDQNLGSWVLNDSAILLNMLDTASTATGMQPANYSQTIIGWANEHSATGTPNGLQLGALNRQYNQVAYSGTPFDTAGGTIPPQGARNYLVVTAGWTITGDIAI